MFWAGQHSACGWAGPSWLLSVSVRELLASCYSHSVINLQVHSVKVWEVHLEAKATTCSDSSCFFPFLFASLSTGFPVFLSFLPSAVSLVFSSFPFSAPSRSASLFFFSFLLPCSLVQLEAKLLLGDVDDGEADRSKLLSCSVLPLFFLLSVFCFLCIFKSFSLPLLPVFLSFDQYYIK